MSKIVVRPSKPWNNKHVDADLLPENEDVHDCSGFKQKFRWRNLRLRFHSLSAWHEAWDGKP